MKGTVLRATVVVLFLSLMACSGGMSTWYHVPAQIPPANNVFEIHAPYNDVWKAAVQVYANRNINIKTIEKESGLIASDRMILPESKFMKYMNPGTYKTAAGLRTKPTSPMLYSNLFIEKVSKDETILRVNLRGTVQWSISSSGSAYKPAPELGITECQSTGVLEASFFQEIQNRCLK